METLAARYDRQLRTATEILCQEFRRPDYDPAFNGLAWLACSVAEELAYEMLEEDAKHNNS